MCFSIRGVEPRYVEADQLNKAANADAQGGHDSYNESIGTRLGALRDEITRAKLALREFATASRPAS